MKQKKRNGATEKRGNGEKTITPSPLHRFSPSRYLLALLLLLTIAITASCGGGGGGGDGGPSAPSGPSTGVWDSSRWDDGSTWGP